MCKIKISPSKAGAFKNMPKKHTIYTAGYFVRDSIDGWTYIVDFPTLLTDENLEIIFDVYFEGEDAVRAVA